MLLNTWQNVPEMVVRLLPAAAIARRTYLEHKQAAEFGPAEFATWAPDTDEIFVYAHGGQPATATKAAAYLPAEAQPDWATEILIKKAALPLIGPTVDFAHKALGGPRPLSNAIVAGLLAGVEAVGAVEARVLQFNMLKDDI